jgi:taurine--2-oxoglutarate transaminase
MGGRGSVEPVRDRETKGPLVQVGATGEANAPMTAFANFAKACLGRGLLPLILGNRIHSAAAQSQRQRHRERSGPNARPERD